MIEYIVPNYDEDELWGMFENRMLIEAQKDIDMFVDKFGQDTYDYYLKSKQRLKNAGYTTDIIAITKQYSKEEFDEILKQLDKKVSDKRGRLTRDEQRLQNVEGKFEYLGTKDGFAVYHPIDVTASMSLGVNSGWCTTGRYGHAGHPEFKPSTRDASSHWNSYTKDRGIKFYYFLDPETMYGKYAVALYPKIINVNREVGNYYIDKTNIEIYNAQDHLDYVAGLKLPLDLIPEEVVFDAVKLEDYMLQDGVLVQYRGEDVNIDIPDTVVTLPNVFSGKDIKTVTMSDSVKYVADGAFRQCTSLTSVKLSNNIIGIFDSTFYKCISLVDVNIPDKVETIGDRAFTFCSSLTDLYIPSSVTTIGTNAFARCDNLTIRCEENSYAHQYCVENNINYHLV